RTAAQGRHRLTTREEPTGTLEPKPAALFADAEFDRALRGLDDALQDFRSPAMSAGSAHFLHRPVLRPVGSRPHSVFTIGGRALGLDYPPGGICPDCP